MKIQQIQAKKGLTLGDAFPAVLTVALVAILLITVLYLFTQFGTAIGSTISQTVINETVLPKTAGTQVVNGAGCNFANFAVTKVTNASNYVLNSANYTINQTGGYVYNLTSTAIYGLSWNFSYTNTYGGGACDATTSFGTQFNNQIPLVGLVLTIVLIAIVIGVLVTSFFVRGGSRV
jgi:hypothetical protein